MDLAEKTLKDLQRISAARAELECGPLARKLIEASIGGQQVSMENETSSGLAPRMIDLQHLVADAVRDLNISSPKDVVRVIDAITPEIFDKGQKQLGRVFVFLVLVVILVQRVAPERPSEEEVSLMSDCVAKCLSQHSQAWVHHQGMKWVREGCHLLIDSNTYIPELVAIRKQDQELSKLPLSSLEEKSVLTSSSSPEAEIKAKRIKEELLQIKE